MEENGKMCFINHLGKRTELVLSNQMNDDIATIENATVTFVVFKSDNSSMLDDNVTAPALFKTTSTTCFSDPSSKPYGTKVAFKIKL